MFSFTKKSVIAPLCCAALALMLALAGCDSAAKENEPVDTSVTIDGRTYSADTRNIVLDEFNSGDYSVFSQLKDLETLDISALDISQEEFDRLTSQLGENVKVLWSVPFDDGKLPSDITEMELSGALSDEAANNIRYFTNLEKLTITNAVIDQNLKTAVKSSTENNPDLLLECNSKIYGVKLDNHTELLNLNKKTIKSLDTLRLAIEIFPNIKTIEMCDCGLSNEVMQGLREEYPDVQFVWMVSFWKYKVRTDIQVFSTLARDYKRVGNSKVFAPLFKYCTELRALDVGHMAITDISDITNLKKLHTLILADNYIEDISPIAELKELVYLELFQNKIKDVSPLLELPKLEDLNLCYNGRMTNPTVLTQIKTLKRLYISHCSLDEQEIEELRTGIPEDCEFNYTAPNCVFSGWRTKSNARNTKIREAFWKWERIKAYPTWDNIIYK